MSGFEPELPYPCSQLYMYFSDANLQSQLKSAYSTALGVNTSDCIHEPVLLVQTFDNIAQILHHFLQST